MISAFVIKPLETDEEIQEKAYVHCKAWQEAYKGIVDQSFLDKLTPERNLPGSYKWKDDTIIAKDESGVIGFAVCGPCRDEDQSDSGEVYAIYILAEHYGQGVGYALMQAALERLHQYERVVVWVLQKNTRAIRFYQRCGFRFDGTSKELTLVSPVTEVRMVLERLSCES